MLSRSALPDQVQLESRPCPLGCAPDDRIIFTHTEVDDAFAGRGVGTSLARGALDTVRKRKEKLVPLCPFIASYVRRHDEYSDLVDVDLTAALRRGSQSSR